MKNLSAYTVGLGPSIPSSEGSFPSMRSIYAGVPSADPGFSIPTAWRFDSAPLRQLNPILGTRSCSNMEHTNV